MSTPARGFSRHSTASLPRLPLGLRPRQPAHRSGPATGTITVPRGEWFWFKYTRGSWDKVEMWPACVEADNRYGFGAAHPMRDDTVFGWADWCK